MKGPTTMRLAITLALALALALAAPAQAHDFWLQPRRFQVPAGAPVPVTVEVGHGRDNDRWGGTATRLVRLDATGPAGVVDLRAAFVEGDGPFDLLPRFTAPGTYVVAMHTTHALSDLPALRFNDYAKLEGVTPILDARARAGTTNRPGREIYSRRAKTIVQSGPPARARHVTRPVGLSLEIVPERDPYALGRDRALPVHVVFEGRRLPGALVKLTDLSRDAEPVAQARTDARGRAVFRVPPQGDWLLNVVWSKPLAGDPRGDFDTTFSSLTFGYLPAAPAAPSRR